MKEFAESGLTLRANTDITCQNIDQESIEVQKSAS